MVSNMKYIKNLKYNIKHMLPILGLAGTSLITSCEKEEPIIIDVPYKNVEIFIGPNMAGWYEVDNLKDLAFIKSQADRPDVKNVFLVPVGTWDNMTELGIHNLRERGLTPALNVSPKVRGRGDFDFYPGAASLVPEDSLWYVENGWTINRLLHSSKVH